MKPFSAACDENKQPILGVIQHYFSKATTILEIGSGTGQHAVFFAEQLPHLQWFCSDQLVHHAGIRQWLAEFRKTNIPGTNISGPYELDVRHPIWPQADDTGANFTGVFSANTAHIMSWPEVKLMFAGISQRLTSDGYFCLYGPFNYGGEYSSASNAQFDYFLKGRDPQSGIRDLAELQKLASSVSMTFIKDHEMPVNNRILVWQKN